MNKYYLIIPLFAALFSNAQVGINTPLPKATLDVNGDAIIRTVPASAAAASYDYLVRNPSTNVVELVNVTPVSNVNASIAKAEIKNGISLLSLGAFGGYDTIDFAATDIKINSGSNFVASTSSTPSYYKVPSTGVYEITYEFRFGTGVQASLLNLGGAPSIAILKKVGTTTSLLDDRKFSGVTVPLLLSIVVSNSTINSIYQLNANDQLSFGFNNGGISLGLLGSSFATVNLRKISD